MTFKHYFLPALVVLIAITLYTLTRPEPNPSSKIPSLKQVEAPQLAPKSPPLESEVKIKNVSRSTPRHHDQPIMSQSLAETEIDGALRYDQSGNLILEQPVRDFFDYFLSASDELGPEIAIAEIQRYIDVYLPDNAAQHASALLGNYLRYKKFEIQLQRRPISSVDQDALDLMESVFAQQKQKRDELFTHAENSALFGLEEAHQSFTLESLRLFADESIEEDERLSRLKQMESLLPAELQQSRLSEQRQRQDARRIKGVIESAQDSSNLHNELVVIGVEHENANELVTYTQQQSEFETRYQKYRDAAKALNSQDQDRIDALKRRYFSSPEEITKASLYDLSR